MYKSPIEIIQSNFDTFLEESAYRAVLNVGINVDKDELKRALEYDRRQYERGFRDGSVKQVPKKPVRNNGEYHCSVCSSIIAGGFYDEYQFCPACGQRIDWSGIYGGNDM